MPLEPQQFIPISKCTAELDYEWEDAAESKYIREDRALTSRLEKVSQRSVGAIALGCAEWLFWRVHSYPDSQLLKDAIDAFWVGLADMSLILPLEGHPLFPRRKEWRGPVRGPIGSGYRLLATVFESVRRGSFATTHTSCLSQLTSHIWKNAPALKEWRKDLIERLIKMFPFNPDAPLGPLVVREMLDPNYVYDPARIPELVNAHARSLGQNPFLIAPFGEAAEK